jgi:hypothetical protein
MRRLTTSPYRGFASLEEVSGWRVEHILADFYLALWADGRVYDAFGMTSWDLFDIYSNVRQNARLQPYGSSLASPELAVSIRAGSTAYLHWQPSGPLPPTSISVTNSSGNPVPGHISVWALRLR